jgi:2-dehydropantoate 2-reductase
MAPFVGPDAIVLSLQNGVDNAKRLHAQLLRTVYPAVVYVAAEMMGPGHLKHHGRGELVVGPSAMSTEMLEVFANAGVPVHVSDNVVGELWAKLILNCAYNAISAITKLPYGLLFENEGARDRGCHAEYGKSVTLQQRPDAKCRIAVLPTHGHEISPASIVTV